MLPGSNDCIAIADNTRSCKETFSLLYYEHDGLEKEPPPWAPDSYKLIDRIAADEGRFTSTSEVRIRVVIAAVAVPTIQVIDGRRDPRPTVWIASVWTSAWKAQDCYLNLSDVSCRASRT